jgi:predicted solute-binding protein
MYPVAMIPYANTGPYKAAGAPERCSFVDIVPRESVNALTKAKVWAAAIPVGGLAKLKGQIDFLDNFGIAANGSSRSVLFFSDKPIDELNRHTSIHLTDQSVSSVKLLYLLLGYRNGFNNLPCVVEEDRQANGKLLIGDEALCKGVLHTQNIDDKFIERYPFVTDLAEEWHAVHKCSFVFARWVIRKDAPKPAHIAMLNWLEKFRVHEKEFILQSSRREADRLGISEEDMFNYLLSIKRVLDEEDIKGQKLFLEEFKQKAQTPLFRHQNHT